VQVFTDLKIWLSYTKAYLVQLRCLIKKSKRKTEKISLSV